MARTAISGRGQGQQDGDSVVNAGIGVDDDRQGRHGVATTAQAASG
jgi:hypothetical protein